MSDASQPAMPAAAGPAAPPFVPKSWPATLGYMGAAVVIGLMPTTGLPLPFFSAGGTSISILMAAVGVVLNIAHAPIFRADIV